MKKLGLLDRLAEQHRTFISNLRLQPSCPASALREGKVFKVNASREELAAWARG